MKEKDKLKCLLTETWMFVAKYVYYVCFTNIRKKGVG